MNHEFFTPFMAWIHNHPQWAGFITFAVAFIESTPIIGILIPGIVFMTIVGILIGSNIIPMTSVFLSAVAGAYLGDLLGYWLGRHYQHNIRSVWPFKYRPHWFGYGEKYFEMHGGKSIFFGRFIGAIRPLIPIIAGTLKMPAWRFLPLNLLAGIIWAIIFLLPGFIIGAASLALPTAAASKMIVYLLGGLLLLTLLFWLIKIIVHKFFRLLDRLLQKLWHYLLNQPQLTSLCSLIKRTHIPDDHTQLNIFIAFCLCTILFFWVLINVITHTEFFHLNQPIHYFFSSLYSPRLEKVSLIITYLGVPSNIMIIWFVALIWLALRRCWYTASHWLPLGLISFGLVWFIKKAVAFPRPTGIEQLLTSFSFPSGHAALSLAIFGFMTVIIVRGRNIYWRRYFFWGFTLLAGLIAASRIILGAHWFTDVFAGLLLGASLLLIFTLIYRRKSFILPKVKEFIILMASAVLILWGYNLLINFKQDYQHFKPQWETITITKKAWWQKDTMQTPLVRKNRLGKPVQHLNIEWLGDIATIKALLLQHGWQEQTESRLQLLIAYVSNQDFRKTFPLFAATYKRQTPNLVLTKRINGQVLILRLWNSHIHILPDALRLWVGAVNFRPRDIRTQLPNALHKLQQDIRYSTRNKLMPYPVAPLNQHQDGQWDGRILLIKFH